MLVLSDPTPPLASLSSHLPHPIFFSTEMHEEVHREPLEQSSPAPLASGSAILFLCLLLCSYPTPSNSNSHEFCYRFIGRPPPIIGADRACVLRYYDDGVTHGGLHLKTRDLLQCSDDSNVLINQGWKTPCAQTTLNVTKGRWSWPYNSSSSPWKDCGFQFQIPEEYDSGGDSHTFECFYDDLTDQFWGRVDDSESRTWKEKVLSVRVKTETNCAWLQLHPGKCGGEVDPPDWIENVTPPEEPEQAVEFWNEKNGAINRLAICPLSEIRNVTLALVEEEDLEDDDEVEVHFSFEQPFVIHPCDGLSVEIIRLRGHCVGYGEIPVEKTVVAQRQGGEVCIGYEYLERTDITESHFGVCKNICFEIDGEPGYIDRKRGATIGGMCVLDEARLEVRAIRSKDDVEKGGGSGPSGARALVFNFFPATFAMTMIAGVLTMVF